MSDIIFQSDSYSKGFAFEQATLYYADLVNKGSDIGGSKGAVVKIAGFAGGLTASLFTPKVYEAGGLPVVVNELTYGLTDWAGLTNTHRYQELEHQVARGLAAFSRELLIAATTGGMAKAASSGSKWAREGLTALRLYEAGAGGYSVGRGIHRLGEGSHWGWVDIAAGVIGISFSFQGLRPVALPRGNRRVKLPVYHDVAWSSARKARNADLLFTKGRKITKGMEATHQWTWEHLFITQKLVKKYPRLRGFSNSYANTFLRIPSFLNSRLNNPVLKWKLRGLVLLGLPAIAYSTYTGVTFLLEKHTGQDTSYGKRIRVD